MRMVVVLPLPLAPRKPQISPSATCRFRPSTTLRSPKLLRKSADVDGVVAHGASASGFTVTGWPGLRSAACGRRRPGFGEEDELAPRPLGIDEGGRVLGLRRNEGDGAAEIGRAIVAGKGDPVADVHAGELGLGNEEADEDVLRRQKRDDRRAGRQRLPGKGDHVGDEPGFGSGDRPLVESPLGLLQRRLERARPSTSCASISPGRPIGAWAVASAAVAAATLASAERRSAVLLIDDLLRRRARFQQRRASPQILLRPVARRLGVAQVGLGLLDLARLRGREEVGELVARLLQEPSRLIDRGPVVRGVLLEQRLALHDAVAARDTDRRQKARLGRADLDEIGLRIALPGDRRRGTGAQQRPGGREHDRRERRQDQNSTNHRDARFMDDARASSGAGFGRRHTLSGIRT